MAASKTAQYVALYRAFETFEPGRTPLFRDPHAPKFLSPGLRLGVLAARAPMMHSVMARIADWRAPGARTSAIARTAYIDDAVRTARSEGIRQIVILGAGFDCRAQRMPELAGVDVFEVDRAETQAQKRAQLPASSSGAVRFVAVDFLRDQLADKLEAAGWQPGQRSLFVWEGVTNYLSEAAVEAVLRWIATTAPRSRVVFTYLHGGLLDGSVEFVGGARLMDNVKRLGEPWTFGLHPGAVAAFVARCGLALRDDLGADDYRRRYLGDGPMPGYAFYRLAVADVPA
jgi:methyltransferase (TIGR00027 family)